MKFAKSPEQGAETSVLLATAAAGRASGGYWVDGKRLGKRKSVLPTVWASHSADCRDAGPGGSLIVGASFCDAAEISFKVIQKSWATASWLRS